MFLFSKMLTFVDLFYTFIVSNMFLYIFRIIINFEAFSEKIQHQ